MVHGDCLAVTHFLHNGLENCITDLRDAYGRDAAWWSGSGGPPEVAGDKDCDWQAGQVQSLTRALALLEAVARSHDGLALTELAQTVGLPPSTAHRLLTTLQQGRFVRFDLLASVWQIGVQAFVVGNAFARTRDVLTMARPHMRRLMEESGETVNLYVADERARPCAWSRPSVAN